MSESRVRADVLAVRAGLAPSRERAQAIILAGRLYAGGERIAKAGQLLAADAELSCPEPDHPYVSRGGLKLAAALAAFQVEVRGRTALDVGASTGGFTDCLLEAGAARVVALDVGRGQLDWSLRNDARVEVRERTHVKELTADMLPVATDLAVIDVSYIALAKVLPYVVALEQIREVVALVKPNFELEREHVGKGGIVRDPALRELAVCRVEDAARALGLAVRGRIESPVRGTKGNHEFLLHLVRERDPS